MFDNWCYFKYHLGDFNLIVSEFNSTVDNEGKTASYYL